MVKGVEVLLGPATAPTYSAYAEVRRNIFDDPLAKTTASSSWPTPGGGTIANVTDGYGSWVRSTRTVTGSQRLIDMVVGTTLLASTGYRVRFKVRGSAAGSVWTVNIRPTVASATGSVTLGTFTVPSTSSEVIEVVLSGTTSATAPTSTAGVTLTQGTTANGSTLDVTDVEIERTTTASTAQVIVGRTPGSDTSRLNWVGTTNASDTILETRSVLTVGSGPRLDIADYNVEEDSNPLEPSDSTGGFGQITLDITEDYEVIQSMNKTLTLTDGSLGTTVGTVRGISGDGLSARVIANSRLGLLAVERTIQPFTGTLTNGILYHLGLCSITSGIVIDPSFNAVNVKLPGGRVNVYDRMVDMGAAYDFEMSLVSNNVVIRPPRQRVAVNYRDASVDRAFDQNNLARSIQAYYYDSWSGTDVAYPVQKDIESAQVYQVDAGETQVFEIPLSASLSTVEQPTCVSFVAYNDTSASVYTVSASDETVLEPSTWLSSGGYVNVAIGEDTRTLIITIHGAEIPELSPFRIAMPSGEEKNQYYSSLRLRGDGIFWNKKLFTFKIGENADLAPDEIGVVVDSEFLETYDQMFHRILRTAERYGTDTQSIRVRSGGINRLGESGSAAYPTIGWLASAYPGATISSLYNTLGPTIADWNSKLYATVSSDFANQAFGNVAGARVRYKDCWYRIRSASITPRQVDYGAQRDNTVSDVYRTGETIAQWNTRWSGKTIRDVNIAPLIPQ